MNVNKEILETNIVNNKLDLKVKNFFNTIKKYDHNRINSNKNISIINYLK
jgi:hypothetical protein|tara:strand:- start:258 stop:407 length:150 start_codon:yes stop_codon:yes gene_type:complete